MFYLKKRFLAFTRWLYVTTHKNLGEGSELICYSKYAGEVNVDFSFTDKNSLVGSVIVLVQKLLTWDKLSFTEIKIAKRLLVEEIGYKISNATKETKQLSDSKVVAPLAPKYSDNWHPKVLQPGMVAVCINGELLPLVQSFNLRVDLKDNLVVADLRYCYPKYYEQEIKHFNRATEHEVEVFIQGVRQKGFLTIFDVIANPSKLDRSNQYTYDYLESFKK
jgi:hypothetical protein